MKINKQIFYQKVIDTFGEDWLNQQWKNFKNKRLVFELDSLDKEIINLEMALHPFVKELIKYQDFKSDVLDLKKIPQNSLADLEMQYLGRDLLLMEKELLKRGRRVINDLKQTEQYYNHRYNLLVASAFKKQGYEVEFVPDVSKEKRPDLLVKGKENFYIECKQRNQQSADSHRFKLLAKISEEFYSSAIVLKYPGLSLRIKIDDDITFNQRKFTEELIERISKNNLEKFSDSNFDVTFFNVDKEMDIKSLLIDSGHFQGKTTFTIGSDSFFSSSRNNNSIFLDKKDNEDLLPSRLYELLRDANNKITNGEKLIAFVDMGKGMEDWTSGLANKLHDDLQKNIDDYPNIDGYVIMQSLFKVKQNRAIVAQPLPFVVFKQSLVDLNSTDIPGLQGSTGLDNYLNLSST